MHAYAWNRLAGSFVWLKIWAWNLALKCNFTQHHYQKHRACDLITWTNMRVGGHCLQDLKQQWCTTVRKREICKRTKHKHFGIVRSQWNSNSSSKALKQRIIVIHPYNWLKNMFHGIDRLSTYGCTISRRGWRGRTSSSSSSSSFFASSLASATAAAAAATTAAAAPDGA